MSAHINIFILPLHEMHLHPFVNGHVGVHGGIGAGHAAQIGEQFFPHLGGQRSCPEFGRWSPVFPLLSRNNAQARD